MVVMGLLFLVKEDSIKFLIVKGDAKSTKIARRAIKKVYKHAKTKRQITRYYNKIKENCGENTSELTIKDALCNPMYRKSTWVNMGYIVFHELTAINVINLYSNQMFKQMEDSGTAWFTPR